MFYRFSLCLIAVSSLLAGCGKSSQPIAVRGQVTFNGTKPPAVGAVYFSPKSSDAESLARPGFAQFNKDGEFVVTTRNPEDGLFPGTYTPRIECWSIPATPLSPPSGKNYVPKNYQPPDVVVESGADAPIVVNFDVR